MKRLLLLLALNLIGFDTQSSEVQSIPINLYDNSRQNTALAEELVHYDPRYLSYQLPSFNTSVQPHIQLGYFSDSQGNVSYRIAYDLDAEALQGKIPSLENEFESYIPKLAQQHTDKLALFSRLAPVGDLWLESLFNEPVDHTLENSSELLQFAINDQQLSIYLALVKRHHGKPQIRTYKRAQFYEAHGTVPESVSLYYKQVFTNNRELTIRVSLHETQGEWKVMGFNVQGGGSPP
jgi:hypothetical protein